MGSAVGLVAGTLGRLYASAFYALQDARTPLLFASVRVVLSAALAYVSVRYGPGWFGVPVELGAVGITATTGFAAWLEYTLLRRALARRIGRTGIAWRRLAWFWGSAVAAGVLGLGVKVWLAHRAGPAPSLTRFWGWEVLPAPALGPGWVALAGHSGLRWRVPGSDGPRGRIPAPNCPLPTAGLTVWSAPVAIWGRPPLPQSGGCAMTRGPHEGTAEVRPPGR